MPQSASIQQVQRFTLTNIGTKIFALYDKYFQNIAKKNAGEIYDDITLYDVMRASNGVFLDRKFPGVGFEINELLYYLIKFQMPLDFEEKYNQFHSAYKNIIMNMGSLPDSYYWGDFFLTPNQNFDMMRFLLPLPCAYRETSKDISSPWDYFPVVCRTKTDVLNEFYLWAWDYNSTDFTSVKEIFTVAIFGTPGTQWGWHGDGVGQNQDTNIISSGCLKNIDGLLNDYSWGELPPQMIFSLAYAKYNNGNSWEHTNINLSMNAVNAAYELTKNFLDSLNITMEIVGDPVLIQQFMETTASQTSDQVGIVSYLNNMPNHFYYPQIISKDSLGHTENYPIESFNMTGYRTAMKLLRADEQFELLNPNIAGMKLCAPDNYMIVSNNGLTVEHANLSTWETATLNQSRNTGKYYLEFNIDSVFNGTVFSVFGLSRSIGRRDNWHWLGYNDQEKYTNDFGFQVSSGGGYVTFNNTNMQSISHATQINERICVAVDFDEGKIWYSWNSPIDFSGTPVNFTPNTLYYPCISLYRTKATIMVNSPDLLYKPEGYLAWNRVAT